MYDSVNNQVARLHAGFTIQQVAALANVGFHDVVEYERGARYLGRSPLLDIVYRGLRAIARTSGPSSLAIVPPTSR
jgi:hypothetical protein